MFYEPEDFYVDCTKLSTHPNGGVAVARGWTVKRIDPFERKAVLEDDYEISYEKCLIATGKIYIVCGLFRMKHTPHYKIKLIVCIHNTYWFQKLPWHVHNYLKGYVEMRFILI